MRRFRRHQRSNEPEETYALSISDLMSSLLTIFILSLTYYILSYSEARAELVDNQSRRTEILLALQAELQAKGIVVEVDYGQGVLHLPEGILFPKGDASLKESGKEVIRVLAPALRMVLDDADYASRIDTIFIEGHTDSDPVVSGRYASNWELSTQRAINTWREMVKVEPSLEYKVNALGQPLFSVSGYADRRPVEAGESEEAKSKNRRIDLRFTMMAPRADEGSSGSGR
ncbi:MAG TPA: OmpA family protein [Firmicutes bacterium]|nr:OmpA family protein [Candidatus Fermentithermobacillaceae bacterium]